MWVGLLFGSQFSREQTYYDSQQRPSQFFFFLSLHNKECRRSSPGRGWAWHGPVARTSTHSRNSGNLSPNEASAVLHSKQTTRRFNKDNGRGSILSARAAQLALGKRRESWSPGKLEKRNPVACKPGGWCRWTAFFFYWAPFGGWIANSIGDFCCLGGFGGVTRFTYGATCSLKVSEA